MAAVARAQAESGLLDDALATVAEIDPAYRSIPLPTIAQAQAMARLWDDAANTANAIVHDTRRLQAFVEIARVQARMGLIDDARRAFQSALDAAHAIPDDRSASLPFSAIARAQAEAGLWEDALVTSNAPTEIRHRMDAWLTITRVQAEAGLWDEAFATANRSTNDLDRAWTLTAIARAQVEAGLFDEAQPTLADAVDAANAVGFGLVGPLALVDIVRVQAEAGLWDEALGTASRVSTALGRSRAFAAVAVVQAQAGRSEAARQTFELARDAAADADGMTSYQGLPGYTWEATIDLARSLAEAGFGDDAVATADGLPNEVARTNALSAIALAQAEAALAAMSEPLSKSWAPRSGIVCVANPRQAFLQDARHGCRTSGLLRRDSCDGGC